MLTCSLLRGPDHCRRLWEDPDENSDSDDEEDELIPHWAPSCQTEKPKATTPSKHAEGPKGKSTANEIEEVTRKLEMLHLDDWKYRVQFAQLYILSPLRLPAGILSLECHLPEVIHPKEHILRLRRDHLSETYLLCKTYHPNEIHPLIVHSHLSQDLEIADQ